VAHSQRFDMRTWNTDDLLEALAVYAGEMTYDGTPLRSQWKSRTLIATYRRSNSVVSHTRGYGRDWKDGLKSLIVAFYKTGELPYFALREGVELLRQRELVLWSLSSHERRCPTYRLLREARPNGRAHAH